MSGSPQPDTPPAPTRETAPSPAWHRPANTLSVCIIARDEEARLGACIESALPFADQVVVVDTGSHDRTVEVARDLGAEVRIDPWRDDFSAARNASLEAARSRWILWMDADDRVPPDQVDSFRQLKTAPPDRAFHLVIVNGSPGRFDERWVQLRMFPNDPRFRFERRVHEQVVHRIVAAGLQTFCVDVRIVHTGYADPELVRAKAQRNRRLLELDSKQYGKDPYHLSALADSYYQTRDFERGIAVYEEVRALPQRDEIIANAPVSIARGYGELGRHAEALRWAEIALERDPDCAPALFFAAGASARLGDEERAVSLYERLLQAPAGLVSTARPDFGFLHALALVHLARLHLRARRFAAARACYERSLDESPEVIEPYAELGLLLRESNEPEAALERFSQSMDLCAGGDPRAYVGAVSVLMELDRSGEAREVEREAARVVRDDAALQMIEKVLAGKSGREVPVVARSVSGPATTATAERQ